MLRLDSDLLDLLLATAEGRLAEMRRRLARRGGALTVVMAAKGYPGAYTKRQRDRRHRARPRRCEGVKVFHAGTALRDGPARRRRRARPRRHGARRHARRGSETCIRGSCRHRLAGRLLPQGHRLAGRQQIGIVMTSPITPVRRQDPHRLFHHGTGDPLRDPHLFRRTRGVGRGHGALRRGPRHCRWSSCCWSIAPAISARPSTTTAGRSSSPTGGEPADWVHAAGDDGHRRDRRAAGGDPPLALRSDRRDRTHGSDPASRHRHRTEQRDRPHADASPLRRGRRLPPQAGDHSRRRRGPGTDAHSVSTSRHGT